MGSSATTYYIAANGSDSNNGTSQATPWLHSPGMPNCSGTCASVTPQGGDRFIFRGGDTWHMGDTSASPYMGSSGGKHLAWPWSGNSSGCQLDGSAGAVVKSGCIYFGVDQSWSAGGSWTRPKFNGDNPLTTSRPSGCTFDQGGVNMVFFVAGSGYTIIDNIEFLGECWNGSPGSMLSISNPQMEVTNCYFHGWTYGSGSSDDEFTQIAYASPGGFSLIDHNVFDGSDSSLGTTPGAASGKILGIGTEIAYNVFWHVSNGYVGNSGTNFHDNLFYYLIEPTGSVHGNIVEMLGDPPGSVYFYNNLMYATGEGEGINIYTNSGATGYIFNNISYEYRAVYSGSSITSGADGSNCYLLENTGNSGGRTFSFFNNTSFNPCSMNLKNISATVNFENNRFLGFSNPSLSGFTSATTVDNGQEVFQASSSANLQSYLPGTTSGVSGASITGNGNNMTAFCNSISNSLVSSACKNTYGGVTYDTNNHIAVPNTPTSRPSSGSWDVGAYTLGSGTSSQPAAPSGLQAIVQ
jgi:hypothetical protein